MFFVFFIFAFSYQILSKQSQKHQPFLMLYLGLNEILNYPEYLQTWYITCEREWNIFFYFREFLWKHYLPAKIKSTFEKWTCFNKVHIILLVWNSIHLHTPFIMIFFTNFERPAMAPWQFYKQVPIHFLPAVEVVYN